MGVKTLKFSEKLTYLFSGGEDWNLYCWDLSTGKAIRNFFGSLGGIYTLEILDDL